jgi:DNA-binding NtrC family response regulator
VSDFAGNGDSGVASIVGRSAAIVRLRERVTALAKLSLPVLVRGEPGSGRSHVLNALRALRGDSGAELWTLRAGDRRLLAPLDPHRSVALDEVGRLSPVEQARWRDVLLGPARPPHASIYATSSDDLAEQVREGRFDAGLAELLTRFTLSVPPLRERLGDLPELCEWLVHRACLRLGREPQTLSRAALRLLAAQSWPGNARELAEALERLVAFASGPRIERSHVEALFDDAPKSVTATRRARVRRQREELARLIDETGGNLAEVARRLEMSRGGVIYRAQKFGLMQKPD